MSETMQRVIGKLMAKDIPFEYGTTSNNVSFLKATFSLPTAYGKIKAWELDDIDGNWLSFCHLYFLRDLFLSSLDIDSIIVEIEKIEKNRIS